jgi:hypothetical protein
MVQGSLFDDMDAPAAAPPAEAPGDPDAQLPERFPVTAERGQPARRKVA